MKAMFLVSGIAEMVKAVIEELTASKSLLSSTYLYVILSLFVISVTAHWKHQVKFKSFNMFG